MHAIRSNKESKGVVDSQFQPRMKVSEQLHTLATCTPGDGTPQCPLDHRIGGPPIQGEHFGEGENLLLLPGIESQIIQPVWHTLQNISVFVYSFLLRGMHLLDTVFLYVKMRIMCTQERPETVPVSMKLENLTSYHNYTVSVVACTTACSDRSPNVTVQTHIGGRL